CVGHFPCQRKQRASEQFMHNPHRLGQGPRANGSYRPWEPAFLCGPAEDPIVMSFPPKIGRDKEGLDFNAESP
ncbi:MAG: hypothetical protein EBZ48_13520, partial [Proteobacteria bacterium]|nr:hypothetical protein [Pseudomonadota bacterium]